MGTETKTIVTDITSGENSGEILYFNGTNWERLPAGSSGNFLKSNGAAAPSWEQFADASSGDVSGNYPNLQVNDLTISGEQQGSILYFDGSNWVQLSPGQSNYVLTAKGVGSNPVWQIPQVFTTAATGDVSGTYPSLQVNDLTITGEQQGSILYFDGIKWTNLLPGANGNILSSQGANLDPVWIPQESIVGYPAGGDLDGTYPNPQIRSGVIVNSDINSAANISVSKLADGPDGYILFSSGLETVWGSQDDLVVGGELSGTIGNLSINNESITFSKIQNIATDRLLGRDTAGTGSTEEISLNSTLEFTGSGSIQRAALTGDVTASAGSNSTTIANTVVTFAKIQNIATDRLLGRDTAGTGSTEEISLGNGLAWSGSQSITTNIDASSLEYNSGIIRRAALTGDVTASAGSNSTTIANDAVTFAKIQNITGERLLGRGEITSGDTTEISLGNGLQWFDTTTISARIDGQSLVFDGSEIRRAALAGDVTVNAGENTTTIENNAVTLAKMQEITTDRLLGRDTSGTGDIEQISLNATLSFTGSGSIQRAALTGDVSAAAGSNSVSVTDLTITSEQQGSILYYNGSNWVQLAPSTSGFVLGTQSTGQNPLWRNITNFGALTELSVSLSSSQDNWLPGGNAAAWDAAGVLFIDTSSGGGTVGGIAAPLTSTSPRVKFVILTSAAGALQLASENVGSSAANRITVHSSATLYAGETFMGFIMIYAGSRWRVISNVGGV